MIESFLSFLILLPSTVSSFFSAFFSIIFLLLNSQPAFSERGLKIKKSSSGKKTALVIGNAEYKSSPLQNSKNDAVDMASVLKGIGFDVILKVDATQREMENAIRKFGKKLKSGGTGIFYYAGHGIQAGGRNYLIPVDAVLESESDIKYEAVDAGFVLAKMEDAGNGLNMVILDACRNNPFAKSYRSGSVGLARMDAPKGTIIAYSTSPGAVAADGQGRNGVYTKYLIRNIKKKGLTIEEILKKVRISVVSETSNRQIPWESSSLMGNFYFIPSLEIRSLNSGSFGIERKVDAKELLSEMKGLFLAGIGKTFSEMAKLDQRLLGKGFPEKIPLRSIEKERNNMVNFIDIRIQSELELWRPKSKLETWYLHNKSIIWLVGIVLTVIGLFEKFI